MPSFGFGNSNRKSAVREAQIIIEKWGPHCNTKRPLSALGYRPPGPKPSYKWIGGQICTNFKLGPIK